MLPVKMLMYVMTSRVWWAKLDYNIISVSHLAIPIIYSTTANLEISYKEHVERQINTRYIRLSTSFT